MMRLVYIVFFLEAGFVLIVIPWLAFWDRNYFAQLLPTLHAVITNNFVRGAVSGLGVINIVVGLRELLSLLSGRASERPPSINPSRLAND
ncbi:MAG: hypothetical protein HYU37_19580 [Acidobacteria bacterium]|nr:hypothetical protein [Acidobacteriota bacterium]